MPSLFFKFSESSQPHEREALLRRLAAADGVTQAAPLSPGSTHPELSRLGFVDVSDADAAAVLERLRGDPMIASVDAPAERKLIG